MEFLYENDRLLNIGLNDSHLGVSHFFFGAFTYPLKAFFRIMDPHFSSDICEESWPVLRDPEIEMMPSEFVLIIFIYLLIHLATPEFFRRPLKFCSKWLPSRKKWPTYFMPAIPLYFWLFLMLSLQKFSNVIFLKYCVKWLECVHCFITHTMNNTYSGFHYSIYGWFWKIMKRDA